MGVLTQVELQTVAVFGSVGTVGTTVLVHVSVRFHVTVQHRLVHARVITFVTLERFRAEVIAEVIFQMVFVLRDKRTPRTLQDLIVLDVTPSMRPKLLLKIYNMNTLGGVLQLINATPSTSPKILLNIIFILN